MVYYVHMVTLALLSLRSPKQSGKKWKHLNQLQTHHLNQLQVHHTHQFLAHLTDCQAVQKAYKAMHPLKNGLA